MTSEQWRILPEYPAYKISNLGKVIRYLPGKGTHPSKLLKPTFTTGYPIVKLSHKGKVSQCYIHRLVTKAFIGLCPKRHETNHKDGIKTNCSIDNLEYVTYSRNNQHAIQLGLRHVPKGREVHTAKLTPSDVKKIRLLRKQGQSIRSIAKLFPVFHSTIWKICSRNSWKCVK